MQESLYNNKFSHIYVEKQIMGHPRTRRILGGVPNARVIEIDNYRELFNRRQQAPRVQHDSQSLILAAMTGRSVYEGARVCQNFGNDFFYYTSNVMNCIFDCEYCYLKGMYPSGNMVIFVNIEDTFEEIENILKEHEAYVCVSYDTDLVPLENMTGFVADWSSFTKDHQGLTIELRTKSAGTGILKKLSPCDRVIFAYTVSPDTVAKSFEHGAGSLAGRIEAAGRALDMGHPVRLCFDPMIYVPNWKKDYEDMIGAVTERIDLKRLHDVSVGSFRISAEYMKQMRKHYPSSAVVQFPYENHDGVYMYPDAVRTEMERFLTDRLSEYMPKERIFLWRE